MKYTDDFKARVMSMHPNYKVLIWCVLHNDSKAKNLIESLYMEYLVEYLKTKAESSRMKAIKERELLEDCPGGGD